MFLTDAELLALVVPIVASATVMLVAWLEVRSVVRRRQRLQGQRAHREQPERGSDVLVEVGPDVLLQAQVGDQLRYFVRSDALKTLMAKSEAGARSHAAE